jgi:hypothetical protein
MPRIDDYKTARAMAVAELKKRNPKGVASRSRSQYFFEEGQEGLVVPYFGEPRRVVWPEVTVTAGDGEVELPLTEQILILHYRELLLVGLCVSSPKAPPPHLWSQPETVSRGGQSHGRHPPAPGRRGRAIPGFSPGAHHPRIMGGG